MESNRRKILLLGTAAVGAVAGMGMGSTSTCSSSGPQVTQQVIDAIQAAVAQACSWVPSVASLIAMIAMFPALAGATTIASTLLTEVSGFLCAQFKAGGGTAGALTAASTKAGMKAILHDNSTVLLHGLVWDEATKKFVEF